MDNFNSLTLPAALLSALTQMGFSKPTPIQAKAIPFALKGRDILGSAQTGTGKTAAFCIPMLAHLMNNKDSQALIMTPTRELATQVLAAVAQMQGSIKAALLIGGASMFKQNQQLRARPRIIVGTPGRINDHLSQGSLRLNAVDFLVLDETDRMLDMGFEVQIDKIVKHLSKRRQTLLFSATLPRHIVKMSEKYLHAPERVAVGSDHTPIAKIRQELFYMPAAEKHGRLVEQIGLRQGSIIVFVKTKRGADRLAKKLNAAKLGADAIHGDLNQNRRNRVIQEFRDKKFRIMVATDVAARGLDIPHIEHVINYDLPQQPEDYIHRIGRTARAGAEGSAACFITPEDKSLWSDIHRLMNPGEKEASTGQPLRRRSGRDGGGARNSQGQRRNQGRIPENGNKSFFARRRKRKAAARQGQQFA